ncbi:MAG: hypothetical protein CL799_00630 [Chromatiales bacterium]|nr:hypothetical protein [Chromatiales bacterium]
MTIGSPQPCYSLFQKKKKKRKKKKKEKDLSMRQPLLEQKMAFEATTNTWGNQVCSWVIELGKALSRKWASDHDMADHWADAVSPNVRLALAVNVIYSEIGKIGGLPADLEEMNLLDNVIQIPHAALIEYAANTAEIKNEICAILPSSDQERLNRNESSCYALTINRVALDSGTRSIWGRIVSHRQARREVGGNRAFCDAQHLPRHQGFRHQAPESGVDASPLS